jgi:hypothetical protein
VYEVEALPSSFEGEIDVYDSLAQNSRARLIHEHTLSDGGNLVFRGPSLDLDAGDYRALFAIKALQTSPAAPPLRVEVIHQAGERVLASHATDIGQLGGEAYVELTLDFSLDSFASGVEFRAFYPGGGAFWFDRITLYKEPRLVLRLSLVLWPLLAGLLVLLVSLSQRKFETGISLDMALRNRAVERPLAILGSLAFLGIWLLSFANKYSLSVERLIHAYVIDDAFYYFETAANLARHGQLSFDGITFSNGFHPLWALLLVPIYWLGLDGATSFLVGVFLADLASAASTLLLFWVLQRRFNVLLAFALALVFLSQVIFPLQYGLETPILVTSFVALMALYQARFQRPLSKVPLRDCRLLGFLLGLVVLARLDHAIFAAVLLALLLLSNRRSLLEAQDRIKLAWIAGIAAFLVLPVLAFNLATTGHMVPVSGVIKRIWSYEMLETAMDSATFFQAKLEGLLMVLVEQKHFFWSLAGGVLILWVLLAQRRSASVRTLLPFILGPLALFAYYLLIFHYPFNSSVWYYPTIWLAGLLTLGLAAEVLLDRLRMPGDSLFQGLLIGSLTVVLAFQAVAQIERQRAFSYWVETQTFEETYKYISWRAAEYVQDHTWSTGADSRPVFAAADAGVLGFVLDEPVINLDGLINNEILAYEQQDKHWHVYAVDKPEIDYVVNAFRHDWLSPPLFEQHFALCYSSPDLSRENLGFRIYGRKVALSGVERDLFTAGCIPGQLSSWWAGELPGAADPVQAGDDGDGHPSTVRCAMPADPDRDRVLVFGPVLSLPAGTYQMDFFLSASSTSDTAPVARLEISNPVDGVVFQRQVAGNEFETVGEFQRFTVQFKLTDDRDGLEFRVLQRGEQYLCVQGIRLLACTDGCSSP